MPANDQPIDQPQMLRDILRKVEQVFQQNQAAQTQANPEEAFKEDLADSEGEEVQGHDQETGDFSELSRGWAVRQKRLAELTSDRTLRPWMTSEQRAAEAKEKNKKARLQASQAAQEYLEIVRGVLIGTRAPLSRSDQAMVAMTLKQIRGQLVYDALVDLSEQQWFEEQMRKVRAIQAKFDDVEAQIQLGLAQQSKIDRE